MSPPPQTPNPCEIAYISHANNSESVRGDFSDCRISEVGLLVQKCCSPKGQQKPNSMLQMRGWEHSDRRGVSQLRHLLRAHQKAVAQTTLASLCCFSFNSEELLNIADLSKKDTYPCTNMDSVKSVSYLFANNTDNNHLSETRRRPLNHHP